MKKLVVLMAVFAIVGLAIPATAQFPIVWQDNFDWAVGGTTLQGQNGWVNPLGSGNYVVETSPSPSVSPLHSIRQTPSVRVAAKRPLKAINGGNVYYRGMLKFWLYDTGGTGSTVDTRGGLYADYAAAGDSGSMTYCQAVGITSSRTPAGYWTVYASSGFIQMDGASSASAPNYLLSSIGCAPAPRVNGWNNVIIDFAMDPYTNVMHSNYYVNLNYEDPQVNAVLDCSWGADKSGTRYNNIRNVAGVFMGSGSAWSNPCYIDNVYFSGVPSPEPSGMIALGTGMIGLLGLIRRRK